MSKSDTIVEGRIGNPRFSELLRKVIENRHGDRLSDEEIEEAALVAKGIHKMESTDGGLSAGRGAQAEVLRNKFGIDYDDIERGAKSLRITGETDSAGAESTSSDELGSNDKVVEKINAHEADPEDLLVVEDKGGWFESLLEEMKEKGVEAEDLAIGRRDDIADAKSEKESLRRSISDAKGISSDSLTNLSLPELRRLTDSGEGGSDPTPDPKSKSPKKGNSVPRGKEDKYSDLMEQKEFYERKSGILAEKELERVESELNSLKGK